MVAPPFPRSGREGGFVSVLGRVLLGEERRLCHPIPPFFGGIRVGHPLRIDRLELSKGWASPLP